MDPFQIKFGNFHKFNSTATYLNTTFLGKWVLNIQGGGRLDAKRHYGILATMDDIWPVGYACAVLCWSWL